MCESTALLTGMLVSVVFDGVVLVLRRLSRLLRLGGRLGSFRGCLGVGRDRVVLVLRRLGRLLRLGGRPGRQCRGFTRLRGRFCIAGAWGGKSFVLLKPFRFEMMLR